MFAEVLLSLPIDRPFTYGIPPQMNVSRGMKVTAPFREKPLPGFILSVTETSPPFPVKPLLTAGEVLIEEPFFGGKFVQTCQDAISSKEKTKKTIF